MSGAGKHFPSVSQWSVQGKAAAELIDPSALVALWIGISILNFVH